MLSICIPIYNFDVTKLVQDLSRQGVALDVPFEILCFDDASEESWVGINNSISTLPGVKLVLLQKNLGRSAIRNLLSKEAKFDYQLFMDCDAEVPSENYLKNYLDNKDKAPVIFGGRTYTTLPPTDVKKLLRWQFGKEREVVEASIRNQRPYRYFMTNNFMVKREVIEQIPFLEEIIGYGHEDTMFAQDLKKNKIKVYHIHNPLLHIGLEDNEEFISKTENGVKNLAFLIKKGKIKGDNKLFSTYKNLKIFGLIKLVFTYLKFRLPGIKRNLLSNSPKLVNLDFYKLFLLIKAMK